MLNKKLNNWEQQVPTGMPAVLENSLKGRETAVICAPQKCTQNIRNRARTPNTAPLRSVMSFFWTNSE